MCEYGYAWVVSGVVGGQVFSNLVVIGGSMLGFDGWFDLGFFFFFFILSGNKHLKMIYYAFS